MSSSSPKAKQPRNTDKVSPRPLICNTAPFCLLLFSLDWVCCCYRPRNGMLSNTIKKLPDGKMADISLKDFSNEISPANELAARRALREVSGTHECPKTFASRTNSSRSRLPR